MSRPVPEAVQDTQEFLAGLDVWNMTASNANAREAHGCREAADSRGRLGEYGIPLWDELKSLALSVSSSELPSDSLVMVHCRGDRQFDFDAIAKNLEVEAENIRPIEAEDLSKLGMAYGLVNPFRKLNAELIHLFDKDLLTELGIPGTVMTNAGERTWGVEFHARELFEKLPNSREVDISMLDSEEDDRPLWATKPKHIGIITGNSPESGMLLWNLVNEHIRTALGRYAVGDTVMPLVTVASIPQLGLTMQLSERHEAVRPYLLDSIKRLCEDGADLIAVACNTTPYFSDEIRGVTDEYDARFVSMPEEVGKWLRSRGIMSVEFVAAKPVAQLDRWSAYSKPLEGMDVHVPEEDTLMRIDQLAYHIKASGASQEDLSKLTGVIKSFKPGSTVLFALTEISQLLALRKPSHKDSVGVVDAMQIYARAIAGEYVGRS